MVAIHVIVVAAVAVMVAILLAAILAVVVVLCNVVVMIVVLIVIMRVTRRFISSVAFAMFLVFFPFFMKSHVSCLLIRDTLMYEEGAKKV